MKALKYFASALALVALFTACEEESEYQPAQLPETQEAYFPATTMTVSMEELTNGFEVELARVNYDEAATATLKSERPEGVNVPSTVSFNAGQEKTTFTVSVDQAALGQGKTFKIVMNVDGESNSPYANQRCTVTLTTWSPTPPASWVPIETEAVFVDNVISIMFNTGSPQYDVYVEKLEGKEIYRIANPFTTYTANGKTYTYPYYTPGDEAADAEEVVWWAIDCSGTLAAEEGLTVPAGSVWVPWQKLGIDWGYGHMVAGSIAGNLTVNGAPATPAQYPIGTYDAATGKITLGMLGLNLPAHGIGVTASNDPETWAVLYLDKNLMGTDFARDCEFTKLQDATMKSEIAGGKWSVALYEGTPADEEKEEEFAEKFGQIIKVENAYTDGFDIYFCVDAEGKISVPEDYASQAMGQTMSGFDLYLNIKKGTFENNAYNLECEMIGVDPTGVKADVNFAEYTEVISVEKSVVAESIDEFCGEFVFAGADVASGEAFEYYAAIEKVSETQAKLKYLLDGSGSIDDGIVLNFADGQIYLYPQDLNLQNSGYDIMINTIGTDLSDGKMYFFGYTDEEGYINPGLVGQLSDAGSIKFSNDPANDPYALDILGFYYAAYQGGEHMGRFTDYFGSVEMTPYAGQAAAKTTSSFAASKFVQFTSELVKREVDRRAKVGNQRAEVKTKNEVRKLNSKVRTEFVTL